jgi:hypothetical protein
MSTLAERWEAELAAQRSALLGELAYWSDLTKEGSRLEKHRSQVERLAAMLEAAVQHTLRPTGAGGEAAAAFGEVTEQLLGLHHVWGFFRSKLSLRLIDRFRPMLDAADELAWQCARPYLEAGGTRLDLPDTTSGEAPDPLPRREPALLYFDVDTSPFAVPRNHAYRNLLPPRQLDVVAAELVKRLPVPVIGIPWHQQSHLPGLAIVAHEAGHLIQEDLRLPDDGLRAAVTATLPAEAGIRWERWLPEVLADVLAVLQLGPAYAVTLADLLSDPAHDVGSAVSGYPPGPTRLAVLDAVLTRAGHQVPGASGATPAHARDRRRPADDAEAVVAALLDTPLRVLDGGRLITDTAWFTSAHDERAVTDADRLLQGLTPTSRDVRELVAAGVHAFRRAPSPFLASAQRPGDSPAERLLAAIVATRPGGTRGGVGPVAAAGERDQATGLALLRALGRATTNGSVDHPPAS